MDRRQIGRALPIVTLSAPPKVITSAFLDMDWSYGFFVCDAVRDCRSLACVRCDIMHQAAFATGKHQSVVILICIILLDILTAGLPIGPFYQGCGTAMFGCHTRWLIRKKFRIDGLAWADLAASTCAPTCAFYQQRREIEKGGTMLAPPCSLMH